MVTTIQYWKVGNLHMNIVIIKGNLVRDPELKSSQSGNMVAKFTVAVARMKKEDPADFLNCVAFGKTAETIANNLVKGNPILIEGHIQTGSYDNKEGKKVYTTDIIVNRFEFIQSKNSGQGTADNSNTKDYGADMTVVDDGDIPF